MEPVNPLPVFVGIAVMAGFCSLLARRISILDDLSVAHAKSLPLDGLRGLLASAVFFHHAYITYIFFQTGKWAIPATTFYAQLGPTAVTLFFFISGFLFWRKMLRNPASVRYGKLIPNRLRRIFPAYLSAVMGFFLFVAYVTGLHRLVPIHSLGLEIASWVAHGFPVPNGPPLNSIASEIPTGGMYWTLQQEWLFYLLLPLLAWFRPIRRMLLLVVIFFVAAKFASHLTATTHFAWGVLYIFQTFLHMFVAGFAIGMLCAYRIVDERVSDVLRSPWMTPIAALLMIAQLFLLPVQHTAFEPVLLAPVFLMIVAGNDFHGLLSSRPLRSLGAVSYSLYLIHGLILHIMTLVINAYHPIRLMTPLVYWLSVLPIGLLVVLWSTVSYRYIEMPFFSRRKAGRSAAVVQCG